MCNIFLLKHVIEENIDERIVVTGRRGRRRIELLGDFKEKELVLEVERGSTKSHLFDNSLWKRLWTCGKTDCRMNESVVVTLVDTTV
jgi:hypothetical protein